MVRKGAALTVMVSVLVAGSAFTSSASAVPEWKCEGGQAENFTFAVVKGATVCVSDGRAEKLND